MKKHGVAGWYWSEKLDGQRCFWDGGVSRGVPKSEVPWANTAKDARYKKPPIATGLWSRYGNVIHAPDRFLDKLPPMLLDGELWSFNKLYRQEISSIIKKLEPDDFEWVSIVFAVFDSPSADEIFRSRYIDTLHFKKAIDGQECLNFYNDRKYVNKLLWMGSPKTQFRTIYKKLWAFCDIDPITIVMQNALDYSTYIAEKQLEFQLDRISSEGGEGLIIRNPDSCWRAERTHDMLKLKKLDDAEGVVIGYISGKETDKGSKLLGRIGALIIDFQGKRLELAGLNDDERDLTEKSWATNNPGKEIPEEINGIEIPRGQKVTFRYRGLSKDGIPQEARYWRKREDA